MADNHQSSALRCLTFLPLPPSFFSTSSLSHIFSRISIALHHNLLQEIRALLSVSLATTYCDFSLLGSSSLDLVIWWSTVALMVDLFADFEISASVSSETERAGMLSLSLLTVNFIYFVLFYFSVLVYSLVKSRVFLCLILLHMAVCKSSSPYTDVCTFIYLLACVAIFS